MENQKWEAKQFRYLYDVQIFAAVVGYKYKKREELTGDTHTIKWGTLKEVEIIPQLINLIALASSKNDTDILKEERDQEKVKIFEEYAEGGFQIIDGWIEESKEVHKEKMIINKIQEMGGFGTAENNDNDVNEGQNSIMNFDF